jgi:hypothetical protein
MVSKVLAAVLVVAVLSVGGYTYWQYADSPCCTPIQPRNTPVTTAVVEPVTPSCCQEPSRVTAAAGECCCESAGSATEPKAEVLAIMPHEVK